MVITIMKIGVKYNNNDNSNNSNNIENESNKDSRK